MSIDDCHIIGWQRKLRHTHTHALAQVGVWSIEFNLQALTTRDKEGKTPIDIARRSGACAEIIIGRGGDGPLERTRVSLE